MKKITTLLVLLSLIFCSALSACDFLASDKAMLDYYSNDSNYEELTGVITSKEYDKRYGLAIDITSNSQTFTLYREVGCEIVKVNWVFALYSHRYLYDDLSVGDTIVFTSASMVFYNGQLLPIVALEKDGQVLIPFEEGKAAYIDWIKNN